MGTEYRLRFNGPMPDEVASVVARQVGASSSAPDTFELRLDSQGPMPDATARIESDGLYYCFYGAAGREALGRLIAALVSRFGPVTVEDWE
jgi:hypothetical protein